VLDYADTAILDKVYSNFAIPRDNIWRQIVSLLTIVNIGGFLLYIIPASLSYHFLFDKRHLNHPLILKVIKSLLSLVSLRQVIVLLMEIVCY